VTSARQQRDGADHVERLRLPLGRPVRQPRVTRVRAAIDGRAQFGRRQAGEIAADREQPQWSDAL
jgi:hypothetical protein